MLALAALVEDGTHQAAKEATRLSEKPKSLAVAVVGRATVLGQGAPAAPAAAADGTLTVVPELPVRVTAAATDTDGRAAVAVDIPLTVLMATDQPR